MPTGLSRVSHFVEDKLSAFFFHVGRGLAARPLTSILACFLLTGILAGGMSMLKSEEEAEILYTPNNEHRAKDAYAAEGELFKKTDPAARLLNWIAYAKDKNGQKSNIMTEEILKELTDMDEQVRAINYKGLTFQMLCINSTEAGFENECDFSGVVDITRFRRAAGQSSLIPEVNANLFVDPFGVIRPTAVYFGGRTNSADGLKVASVNAFSHNIKLDDTVPYAAEDLDGFERQILNLFLDKSKALKEAGADWDVAIDVSFSNQEELTNSTSGDTPLLIGSFILVISFSLLITHSYMNSRLSKSMVMNGAILGIYLAIGSSWGLMGYIGIKFNPVVTFTAFLLLGLGVDDAFVILQAYHNTAQTLGPEATIQDRIGHTFKHAGVSILFTSLTDCLAFVVGSTSVFPSVVAFCQYSSAGILLLFLYEVVLVGACLALDTHREYCGYPWYMGLCGKGWLWGEKYDCTRNLEGQVAPGEPTPIMPEMKWVFDTMGSYGRTLTSPAVSACITALFAGYLAFVGIGCTQVGTGLDLRDLVASDSYWTVFVEKRFEYFQEKGITWALLTDEKGVPFEQPEARQSYMNLIQDLEGMECLFQEPGAVWLREYETWAQSQNVALASLSGDSFYQSLEQWLAGPGYGFRKNVILEKDGSNYMMKATRSLVRMEPWSTTSGDGEGIPCTNEAVEKIDEWYKSRGSESKPMLSAEVMQFWESSAVIVEQTMFNLLWAGIACFAITLLVMPHPLLCCLTMAVVASILGGVVASMALIWDIKIETISMINLVLSIGFSVDNVAHYCHAYMTSRKPTRKEKAIDALQRIGMPILNGDISTMLALMTLLASKSRIFFSFFCVTFTVLLLGGIHAVVVLPVLLGYIGPLTDHAEEDSEVQHAAKPSLKEVSVTSGSEPDLEKTAKVGEVVEASTIALSESRTPPVVDVPNSAAEMA